MKKLLSTGYKEWAFNVAMLIIRLVSGLLIIPFGYNKLIHFSEKKHSFMNFMGIGSSLSLSLVIFAEFFCGMLIVAGFLTRLAAATLVISLSVVVFKVTHGDIFGQGKEATHFLAAFLVILLCGPGRASVDGLIVK